MARFVTITNKCDNGWGVRKRTISQPKQVGKITTTFLLGALICVAAILYIFQINKVATMGFEIKKQEQRLNELQRENDRLKIRAAELKSIYNLDMEKQQMQMKKPGEVSYIEVQVENPVALK